MIRSGIHRRANSDHRAAFGLVRAVQTDDRASQVHADGARHFTELGQGVTQQGRFVAVAGCGNEWRDDVAVTIAEGHDLVAFQVLLTVFESRFVRHPL
ncbi:hypothetical protein [Paraburkholderia ultramafica]|uniref:hypothetical protein n=1 Tax=Paraburkholderia ultramafica TaxID=1544867 RepID=UPI001583F826|nr:hypothetical protein [Paraburkholderia ultramafica]